jgi:ABC-type branched-subunit amino acid transport system substrate-binding protein
VVAGVGVDTEAKTITLGVLADLTGPFASLSTDVFDAYATYWDVVNSGGGVDGWTVVLETANTRGDPDLQREAYAALRTGVLSIGLAVGSDANAAVVESYISDDMIVVPISWYSGWPFRSVDGGVALEQYTNYCLEAMNAIDFVSERGATTVAIVTNAGLFGEDAAAGARVAIDRYDLTLAYDGGGSLELGADLGSAITGVVESGADWTFLATSPAVTPQIVAGAAQAGYEGLFIGAAPSYDARILDAASAELLAARFFQSAYAVAWGDPSPGNQAMMDAMIAAYPDRRPSDAFIVGWNAGVTMRSVLSTAIRSGDLTRSSVLAIANSLESVSFDGSAPDQRYVGQPDEFVTRATAIYQPDLQAYLSAGGADQTLVDPGATTGSVLVRDFTVGRFTESQGFTAPCVPLAATAGG